MSRSTPSHKPRRPNGKSVSLRAQPWLLNVVLSPAESVVDTIMVDGFLLSIGDMPVCKVPYHQYTYAAAPALQCVAGVFDIARVSDPHCPSPGPLHVLAAKLDRDELLAQEELIAARKCLAQLRIYAGRMTIDQMRSLLRTAAIRLEMDGLAPPNTDQTTEGSEQ